MKNFYVDDLLKSSHDEHEMIEIIEGVTNLCNQAGFHLTKFVSNSDEILKRIKEFSSPTKFSLVSKERILTTGVLGMNWCVRRDSLVFEIKLKEQALTRRSMLSTVSSIYDPMGLISPFLLKGKRIIARLCLDGVDWDTPVDNDTAQEWKRWKTSISSLDQFSIGRCFKTKDFGTVKTISLHHFADASQTGYGECTYIRLTNDREEVYCSLIMGKSRVWPKKEITIPRKELVAATVAAKVAWMIRRQLECEITDEVFWSDSKVVLGYIANKEKRYEMFVANRIQIINDLTNTTQWRYIESSKNPADAASRGLNGDNLDERDRWFNGPEFLWKKQLPIFCEGPEISDEDKVNERTLHTTLSDDSSVVIEILNRQSNWMKAKRIMAYTLRFIANSRKKASLKGDLKSTEIESSEIRIFQEVQRLEYRKELKDLKSKRKTVQKASLLSAYDVFLDEQGIIRLGGRLRKSDFPYCVKCPVILPGKGPLPALIIRHCHQRVEHGGRNSTLHEIRQLGLWIVRGGALVRKLIHNCVTCRALRGQSRMQKTADLPWCRTQVAPPFTYCGVDFFGPLMVKERRSQVKRYGCLFTCMASRAIHVEMTHSLNTESFINALRRFIARRGSIKQLYSDQGSNFIGAENELKHSLQDMDQQRVKEFLTNHGGEYIVFKRNTPYAHHMGGVWERQIRSIKAVLMSIMRRNPGKLNDESLTTFLSEAEAIVNSRPLTTEYINDPDGLCPISPNQVLTMKRGITAAPPGDFSKPDRYCQKMWRLAQCLADEFWRRWRKEYLTTLQPRKGTRTTCRNFKIGDIVLLKDETNHRGKWPLAKVIRESPDAADGLNRRVTLLVSDASGLPHVKERAVNQLIMLVEGHDLDESQCL